MQGLKDADPADVACVDVIGPGSTLHWETLDVQHGLASLLKGVFGNRRWMSARSAGVGVQLRRAAARKNGRKGGRRRKAVV
jgi:hypothetical protein